MDYIEVRTETTHDAAELLAELLAEITGGAQVDDPQTIEDFVNAPVKKKEKFSPHSSTSTPRLSHHIQTKVAHRWGALLDARR